MTFKTWNFDVGLGAVRSVVRGEVAGSVRLVAFVLLALAVWVAVSWTADWTAASASSLAVQEGRYRTLVALAEEYRALAPAAGSGTEAVDVPTVFTQVSERMSLGSRVNRIAPDGRNQSIEVNRLYAEELTELVRELAMRGVHFLSSEIRALPAGQERLFTVSAIIGPLGTEGSAARQEPDR